jgi:hypothetical protein
VAPRVIDSVRQLDVKTIRGYCNETIMQGEADQLGLPGGPIRLARRRKQ